MNKEFNQERFNNTFEKHKALLAEALSTRSDFENHVHDKPYVVVVRDSDTNKKREIGFDNEAEAKDFKMAAEEDGTYYGYYTNRSMMNNGSGSDEPAPFGVEEHYPSGGGDKADYSDQLRMAYNKAKKDKNVEAMVYYRSLGNTSGNASFEKFKGSWAHGEWLKKPEIAKAIADVNAHFKSQPWLEENDMGSDRWEKRKERWDDYKNKNKCPHCNGIKLVKPCVHCDGKGYMKNEWSPSMGDPVSNGMNEHMLKSTEVVDYDTACKYLLQNGFNITDLPSKEEAEEDVQNTGKRWWGWTESQLNMKFEPPSPNESMDVKRENGVKKCKFCGNEVGGHMYPSNFCSDDHYKQWVHSPESHNTANAAPSGPLAKTSTVSGKCDVCLKEPAISKNPAGQKLCKTCGDKETGGINEEVDFRYSSLMKEMYNLSETVPPNFPKDLRDKLIKQYGNSEKAYATMWSLHNKHGDSLEEAWNSMRETHTAIDTINATDHSHQASDEQGKPKKSPDEVGQDSVDWKIGRINENPFEKFKAYLSKKDTNEDLLQGDDVVDQAAADAAAKEKAAATPPVSQEDTNKATELAKKVWGNDFKSIEFVKKDEHQTLVWKVDTNSTYFRTIVKNSRNQWFYFDAGVRANGWTPIQEHMEADYTCPNCRQGKITKKQKDAGQKKCDKCIEKDKNPTALDITHL